MRLIEVETWNDGMAFVNIDKIRFIREKDGGAVIAFGDDCYFETAERMRSIHSKIKKASAASKTGGAK